MPVISPVRLLRSSLACHGQWPSSLNTLGTLQYYSSWFVYLSRLSGATVPAHRAILVARCEVMAAMFNGNYMEAKSVLIPVYGVSKETFLSFLEYLYTDSCCPGMNFAWYKTISSYFLLTRFSRLLSVKSVLFKVNQSWYPGICWAVWSWDRENIAFSVSSNGSSIWSSCTPVS